MPRITYRRAPVVIIGSGAAGLACALALRPMPVVVLTKTATPTGGSSPLAQGGIAAALGATDSPDRHAADTRSTGDGLSDPDRVAGMVKDGLDAVEALIAAGFPVDRDADGGVSLGREAAHSHPRIIHAGGDATGRNLVSTLLVEAEAAPSINIIAGAIAVDLLMTKGRVSGVLAYTAQDGWVAFAASNVILATGGVGALWRETTNPPEATGDGLALAARAGGRLADLEFVQFHPTALDAGGGTGGTRLGLLTEALRGAGARLIDRDGRSFMEDEHPLGDLAPRDTVARAIWRRRAAGDAVFLDLRPALADQGEQAFPQSSALCRAAGYEPTETPVPVTPAAHYHMGGVLTDGDGQTSIPGLWACGEVASTGVHGANRLASNSLIEALVFARRCAERLRACALPSPLDVPGDAVLLPSVFGRRKSEYATLRARARAVMSRHVGIVRHGPGLLAAMAALSDIEECFDATGAGANEGRHVDVEDVRAWSELRNILLAGRLITLAALQRPESRGAHCRSDFPKRRGDWARRQILTMNDAERSPRRVAALAE